MRQRGYTLLEVLVAAAIGAAVAVGLSGFFLATLRFGKDSDAQVALQRQGTAIAEELGRRLRQADGSPKIEDPAAPPPIPSCLPLATNDLVLVIANPDGSATCMYRDTSAPPLVVRCTRPTPADSCDAVARGRAGQRLRHGARARLRHDHARGRALRRGAAGGAPEARQPDQGARAGDCRGGPGARASPLLPGVRLWSP